MFPYASFAVIVIENGVPAACGVDIAENAKLFATLGPTTIALLVPVLAPSWTDIVSEPVAAVTVALNVATPFVNKTLPGERVPVPSQRVGVPPYVVTVFPQASFAVIVTGKALPAVTGLEIGLNTNALKEPGVTSTGPPEPRITPSFAAIVIPVPAVVIVAGNVVVPFENVALAGVITPRVCQSVAVPP